MAANSRILLIEDDPGAGTALQKVMRTEGHIVDLVTHGERGLALLGQDRYDLVITDLRLPGLNGLELVEKIHHAHPNLPIILMTAYGTTEVAIQAMKLGAMDYVTKPFEVEELLALVGTGLANSHREAEDINAVSAQATTSGWVGRSRSMQTLFKEIGRVAGMNVTVLIRGATGTGKELVARALYQHSNRAGLPFIAINCAAIPQDLLESELFGHERGAFTGATQQRAGRFEQADGGTLFLDEVGDLPMETQAKLLRVLQERCFHRVGGDRLIEVDVRILAATHRDLEVAIQEKDFRQDLYYRLSVVTLRVPPLSERREDIPDLVRFFLARYAAEFDVKDPRVTPAALEYLSGQAWPGNVRELENTVRQVLLLAKPFPISAEHCRSVKIATEAAASPSTVQSGRAAWIGQALTDAETQERCDVYWRMIQELEAELFPEAVRRAQGNQSKAARRLGVTRLKLRETLAALRTSGKEELPQ